jgi:hypothetical protein
MEMTVMESAQAAPASERRQTLSGANYEKGSMHRRNNAHGLDFMSEEDHLRFVMIRVQQLDNRARPGEGEACVEGYATEESLLSMLRMQVRHLADIYREYQDESDLLEAGGGLAAKGDEAELPWAVALLHRFLGPALPIVVLVLVLALAAGTAVCFAVGGKEEGGAVLLALTLSPFGALLRRVALESA